MFLMPGRKARVEMEPSKEGLGKDVYRRFC